MPDGQGWSLWLTGRPASGKTTLARSLRLRLHELGTNAVILDSDEVRQILTPNPTYTAEERDQFYRGLLDLAQLITRYGVNVIIAATGTRRAYREAAREQLHPFAEVWVRCPLAICRARDPKRLYARAEAGEIDTLPGMGVPYEVPDRPAVTVDTDCHSPAELADKILAEVAFLSASRQSSEVSRRTSDD